MFKIFCFMCFIPSLAFCGMKEDVEKKLDSCRNQKCYVEQFEPQERCYMSFLYGKEIAYLEMLEIIENSQKNN